MLPIQPLASRVLGPGLRHCLQPLRACGPMYHPDVGTQASFSFHVMKISLQWIKCDLSRFKVLLCCSTVQIKGHASSHCSPLLKDRVCPLWAGVTSRPLPSNPCEGSQCLTCFTQLGLCLVLRWTEYSRALSLVAPASPNVSPAANFWTLVPALPATHHHCG